MSKSDYLAVLLLVVPFVPPLLLCFPPLIFAKGFSLGFTASMTFETLGLAGIRQIALTLFFGKLIQLPLLCLLNAHMPLKQHCSGTRIVEHTKSA